MLADYNIQKTSTLNLVLRATEAGEAGAASAGASVAVSSWAPLLQADVEQAPAGRCRTRAPFLQTDVVQAPAGRCRTSTMSVFEAEAMFMTRFNLSPTDCDG
jgi:hypothetical protein